MPGVSASGGRQNQKELGSWLNRIESGSLVFNLLNVTQRDDLVNVFPSTQVLAFWTTREAVADLESFLYGAAFGGIQPLQQSSRRPFSSIYFPSKVNYVVNPATRTPPNSIYSSNRPPGTPFPQGIPRHVHWLKARNIYLGIVSVKTAEAKVLMRIAGNSERRPAANYIDLCFWMREYSKLCMQEHYENSPEDFCVVYSGCAIILLLLTPLSGWS